MAGKTNGRMDRINEEVRRELSEILREEVKDPRVDQHLLSVIKADTSKAVSYTHLDVYKRQDPSRQLKEKVAEFSLSEGPFTRCV